ncbi:MAG: hypothetical protein ACHQHN_11805 [Sphingobacteriales bacterium]
MKILLLAFCLTGLSYSSFSQNTFPASGNVGIGISAPNSPLHILGSSAANQAELRIQNTDSGGSIWRIGDAIGAPAGTFTIYNVTNSLLPFTILGNNGNVGIGTATPNSLLNLYANAPAIELSPSSYGGTTYGTYLGSMNTAEGVLQLGNNGQNDIVGGNNNVGGFLRFIVNNTSTFPSAPNGIVAMLINSSGNVGIGTTSPSYKLDVNGGLHTVGTSELGGGYFHVSTDGSFTTSANYTFRDGVGINNPNGSSFANGSSVMSVGAMSNGISLITTGNIGIGTTDTKGYMLAVNGPAIATSVIVKLYANWPDYVFKKDYRLPKLSDVKTYIDKNHHLPEMPTEVQIAKDGLNLGEMNKLLVKKMEELTLYLIDKDQEIKTQQQFIQSQQAMNISLQKQLDELRKDISTLKLKQ